MRAIIPPEGALNVPAAPGDGTAKVVGRFDMARAAVQFTVGSGEYSLQGSIDGNTWVDLQTGITASVVFSFSIPPHDHFWRLIRVVTTSAGTATATLGAHEYTGHGT